MPRVFSLLVVGFLPWAPMDGGLAPLWAAPLASMAGAPFFVEEPVALATPADPGRLVIIGGGLAADNEAVYRSILEARQGEGPICVIPTAGADPESSMESAVARFARWGGDGSVIGVFLPADDPDRADDPEVAEALRQCGGFFFTGGVQRRIVEVFRPDGRQTAAAAALFARWGEGAVVSGSSAGAAIMSDPMIGGGTSLGAFRSGGFSAPVDGLSLEAGLGFVPDLLMDQHFLARGRFGRLLVAVLSDETPGFGAGIDENTALILEGTRAWVVGASGVVMVDARGAVRRAGGHEGHAGHDGHHGHEPDAFEGVRVELLGPGDTMDLTTGEVTPAASKVALRDHSAEAHPPEAAPGDGLASPLFDPWVLLHTFAQWGGASPEAWGSAAASNPVLPWVLETQIEGVTLRFESGDGFRGLGFAPETPGVMPGVRGTPAGLSVGPVWVSGQWGAAESRSIPNP
jgi:cyanophycinase